MNNLISCHGINYQYRDGKHHTQVIKDLNLDVAAGESIAILGQSGCGKSTLLNLLGGIDRPDSGQIKINNTDINTLDEQEKSEFRSKNLSFIYQFHHLLKDFSALKNIMMPLLIQSDPDAKQKAMKILNKVGLESRANHLPSELSGGERQRVAIARALITQPKCLLADEPTGNLDGKNAQEILDLMMTLNQTHNNSLIVVTHDEKIAARMRRVLVLENGQFS
ncbi:ABC transporter ATP-binding protein [Candidatus Thioglobus sp.]|jgi:lipoprotein-releasing system ATP-binding protein|uniref:ABC transporter ATP-binding protein n=1 Tax=Candidatus Thioglobus sp. TaxID=2026721 RepID=UPI001D9047B1|nr:ABC transporter ATP-binding protein [Candidatus Thioglobus sp.]MBT3277019.1 ABC transporter ATP-binding protein [Candidatus Thioglobus sp.]MBT3446699.1 ABC transporter ATP-binding protein [Candidatus Thioglobus sp.]MBT3744556.1 ABC transporter ATP-binding protein [Candidatus Thioglobus sp.]MBT4001451.1 ABC transporter ATP-binding protein [Candidatus Thioglobus sp.]MBT4181516.1 ABC transporter ATP-binding protein [Candidatus Thioglobus sp.]